MALFGSILFALVGLYSLMVVIRIIVEMIQSFSKHFDPPRWFMIAAEYIFVATDPAVKALRRLIPPLRLGNGIGIDISVIALFLILALLQFIIHAFLVLPFLR
ncbi:YggT family protein [Corynebacterium qintianiae]|uniref:YggT family protein n=1 Tax=Corynebacterium qintianiae TaxID=2709392 RepID=A0A7T0PF68_9CORY|nr:YggT family protein [Corynebacterium qintianiae]QPK82677.1 YggT family protein [Corynebacterium qintianiae]